MTPAFNSWAQFFAMGGYGFYVWLSVSVTLITLAALILQGISQRRSLFKQIRQQQSREARLNAAKKKKSAEQRVGESQ